MAEVNQDLVQQLEQNLASFEAAGPAFEDDVKAIKAKLAKVKGGKAAPKPAAAKPARARKNTVKRNTFKAKR